MVLVFVIVLDFVPVSVLVGVLVPVWICEEYPGFSLYFHASRILIQVPSE